MRYLCLLLVPSLCQGQNWQALPAEELSPEQAADLATNSPERSLEDFTLAVEGYKPLIGRSELQQLLLDHISTPRELDTSWERPPPRSPSGRVCSNTESRARCQPADPDHCLGDILRVLLEETHHALAFVRGQVQVLTAVVQVTGTQASQTQQPPLGGRALASVRALDSVLGLYLGMLERVDFNPRLAACMNTPFGQRLRETVLLTLEQQGRLLSEAAELRWELAANSRLAHARYGLHWHADTAHHVALQAGWALFELARLELHVEKKLLHAEGATELLRPLDTDLEAVDWAAELRAALHLGGRLWHLDGGLLRFLLARVLLPGDVVCDLGAFGGHYSKWLNETGLVTAFAYDGLPGVEELTSGRVRFGRLEDSTLVLDVGRCDVVLCLEVLEHIPHSDESAALRNLGRWARRQLVASWAPPWVPGPGHVNGRPPEEVRGVVENATGLTEDPALTAEARARAELTWIAESVAIYSRTQLVA